MQSLRRDALFGVVALVIGAVGCGAPLEPGQTTPPTTTTDCRREPRITVKLGGRPIAVELVASHVCNLVADGPSMVGRVTARPVVEASAGDIIEVEADDPTWSVDVWVFRDDTVKEPLPLIRPQTYVIPTGSGCHQLRVQTVRPDGQAAGLWQVWLRVGGAACPFDQPKPPFSFTG